ncbi:condensation domain-containing protein [Streptomyces sp. HSW2009]|uniref:condensation domain-containing protein n=1 Tax=Streptomyces sp. HSW2009 TaxID=3142890 RepID=UPI0032ED0450
MIPLSHAQQRLWFLNRLEGPNATYNMPAVLRPTGALDRSALVAAPQDLIDRHEPLRTVFIDRDDMPYQHIIEPGDARIDVTITKAGPVDFTDRITELAARPFDLATEIPAGRAVRSGQAGTRAGSGEPSHRCGRLVDGPTGP